MSRSWQIIPRFASHIVYLICVVGLTAYGQDGQKSPDAKESAKHKLNLKARDQYFEISDGEDERLEQQEQELYAGLSDLARPDDAATERVRQQVDSLHDLYRRQRASLHLVVMIDALMDDLPTVGAGIVFARSENRLLIVTANHVVRHGSSTAKAVHVKFKDNASLSFDASLSDHFDAAVDVAVLTVALDQIRQIDYCSWFMFMDSTLPRRGEGVYAVGNPRGFGWAMSVTPEYVAQTKDDRILFQSTFVGPGHSGGALLNKDGKLIGMIESDQSPYGVAIRLTRVVQILRSWGYVVELYARTNTDDPATTFDSFLDEASASGDVATVKKLTAACPDVNSAEMIIRPPWALAVGNGQAEVLKFFITLGAGVNIPFDVPGYGSNMTALEWAAKRGHAEVLKILLAAGADPFSHEGGSYGAMQLAAVSGHVEVIKILSSFHALVEGDDSTGETPFMSAIRGNQFSAAKALLELGAKVDHRNHYGATSLHWAAYEQNLDAVKFLLEAGADVNATDGRGMRPLHSLMNSPYIDERAEAHRAIEALLASHGAKK